MPFSVKGLGSAWGPVLGLKVRGTEGLKESKVHYIERFLGMLLPFSRVVPLEEISVSIVFVNQKGLFLDNRGSNRLRVWRRLFDLLK